SHYRAVRIGEVGQAVGGIESVAHLPGSGQEAGLEADEPFLLETAGSIVGPLDPVLVLIRGGGEQAASEVVGEGIVLAVGIDPTGQAIGVVIPVARRHALLIEAGSQAAAIVVGVGPDIGVGQGL